MFRPRQFCAGGYSDCMGLAHCHGSRFGFLAVACRGWVGGDGDIGHRRFNPAHQNGAFGKVLGMGIMSILPSWGRIILAPLMLLVAIAALYMASALALSEWHVLAKAMHQAVLWSVRQARFVAASFWRILNNDKTGARDDEEDAEDEDEDREEPEEEVDEDEDAAPEAEEKPAPAKRVKTKAPLVKRPAASARQARLPLQKEGEHPLPPLDLLQWPDEGKQTANNISEEALEKNAKLLESVLADFGVNGTISKVSPGRRARDFIG